MASGKSGCATWLKFGCFGCLGIIILAVLASAGVFMVAKSSVSDAELQERELKPALPRASVESLGSAESGDMSVKDGDGGLSADLTTEDGRVDLSALAGPSGRLAIYVESAELKVTPLPPGEELRVETKYDAEGWDLVERAVNEPGKDWEYEVSLTPKGNLLFQMIRQLVGGESARVHVFLPTDQRMALDLELATGGGEVDLTGVDLSDVRLAMDKGGLNVRINEPSPTPVESFVINASMGGFDIAGLANASPQALDIRMSMGGGAIDLRGDWRTSSDVKVKLSNGGGVIQLPSNAEFTGLNKWGFDDADPASASGLPLLKFEVDGNPNDLQIQ